MQSSPKMSVKPFQRFTIDFVCLISPNIYSYSYIIIGTCVTTKYIITNTWKNTDGKRNVIKYNYTI